MVWSEQIQLGQSNFVLSFFFFLQFLFVSVLSKDKQPKHAFFHLSLKNFTVVTREPVTLDIVGWCYSKYGKPVQGCSHLLRVAVNSRNTFKHSELISIRLDFIIIEYSRSAFLHSRYAYKKNHNDGNLWAKKREKTSLLFFSLLSFRYLNIHEKAR